jgi:hypothetical protein
LIQLIWVGIIMFLVQTWSFQVLERTSRFYDLKIVIAWLVSELWMFPKNKHCSLGYNEWEHLWNWQEYNNYASWWRSEYAWSSKSSVCFLGTLDAILNSLPSLKTKINGDSKDWVFKRYRLCRQNFSKKGF